MGALHEDMHSDESGNSDEDSEGADRISDGVRELFEDLPPLAATSGRHGHRARRPQSKGKRSQSPFMPEYLESTAYGAQYHRHLLDQKHQSQRGVGDSAPTASGDSVADDAESSVVPHVAPDMFFRTLVQDTWPHYCTPVPTMPSLTGLRLGYGLGISDQINAVLPQVSSGSSEASPQSTRRSAAGDDDESSASWRARLIPQRPTAGGAILSRQQGSQVAQGQAQRGRAAGSQGKSKSSAEPEQAQQLPSEWSLQRIIQNLSVDSDRVSVEYTGPGRHDSDAAMILGNASIPARTGVYYFEIYIRSRGQNGYIGVGLARAGLNATRLPGWDPGSWGYHGDDGHGFAGSGSGSRFGPRFTTGDTVGCGIDFMKRRIFFTNNGVFLGHAFETINTDKDLYPCVGMRTPGEYVVANFGRRPFAFDIASYVKAARDEALKQVQKASLRALLPSHKALAAAESADADAVQVAGMLAQRGGLAASAQSGVGAGDAALSIVLTHLLHSEHYGTARALIENAIGQHGLDAETNPRLATVLEQLSRQDQQRGMRRRICKHICDGDIDHALGLLQDAYPQVLEDESLVFQLRCRQFIELVRAASGQHIADSVPSDDSSLSAPLAARGSDDMMDVDDSQSASVLSLAAITNAPAGAHVKFGQIGSLAKMDPARLVRVLLEYGRQLQADYGSSPNPIIREGLVHTFSLLAYADPAQSPIAALLDPSACRPLSRLVEMAIMATEKAPRMSSLECICRQASTLLGELSARRNGAAALISVERDVLQAPGVVEPRAPDDS
ncbi:hypothetical protein H4S02_006282 [Coemansia sp. RSA 2611]|nr:hypothetical protein H4S02_006282 [Coemansia sp. RSA 2611]